MPLVEAVKQARAIDIALGYPKARGRTIGNGRHASETDATTRHYCRPIRHRTLGEHAIPVDARIEALAGTTVEVDGERVTINPGEPVEVNVDEWEPVAT